jgi:hypothetical protein
MKPCFWYLACSIVFGLVGFLCIERVPELMERFRPNFDGFGGLLPVPFIVIKQAASLPAWISLVLLCLFLTSFFEPKSVRRLQSSW